MGPLGTMLLLYCFELVLVTEIEIIFRRPLGTEAALQRCSYKKVFRKYEANLQENTLTEVRFAKQLY